MVINFKCNVFLSLLTGSRKSLCYAVLSLAFDRLHEHVHPKSIIGVIGPLKALMKVQV